MRSRSVYWFLFPLLTGLLILIRIRHHGLFQFWQPALINLGFVIAQLFILTIYFSMKNKKWINVTSQLLGWGDVLFLLSIAFYLSVLNFLFFYISSLIGILALWLTWQLVSAKKNKYIPLAGLQSLIFIVFLASDWWCLSFDLTDDTWLLNLITK
jgi:formate hydrogenlyase subunit 3/multisubunit Na+/H+ antiporter MnhD subunit